MVPSLAHFDRAPTGVPWTAVQVPMEPGMPHASHVPAHGVSQQTPSTQLPELQTPGAVQEVPFAAPVDPLVVTSIEGPSAVYASQAFPASTRKAYFVDATRPVTVNERGNGGTVAMATPF